MTDLNEKSHLRRRTFCLGTSATLMVVCGVGPAGANQYERDRDRSRISPFKMVYSVAELLRLSKSDARMVVHAKNTNPDHFRIEGFNRWMSGYLIEMLYLNPGATKKLVRDLSKTGNLAARKARLKVEVNDAKADIASLEAKHSTLTAKAGGRKTFAITRTEQALGDARLYLKGVEFWHKYPDEGTH